MSHPPKIKYSPTARPVWQCTDKIVTATVHEYKPGAGFVVVYSVLLKIEFENHSNSHYDNR